VIHATKDETYTCTYLHGQTLIQINMTIASATARVKLLNSVEHLVLYSARP